ncbi:MAG: hypothetical protein IJH39_03995 [Clostridia bacterium]|nr:hypothetical protein [Clostridia bacterium]
MVDVLLLSEDYLKTNSSINENYFGRWLRPAIKEAQNIGLQQIIGQCLFEKIINLVKTSEITLDENAAYKDLLDNYIRDYLIYETLKETVPIANVKIANIGTKLTEDERIVSLTQGEADLLQKSFNDKADFYTKRMQDFILNNLDAFPEIEQCECDCRYVVKPCLKATATTNLYLGGDYGKRVY